MPVRRIEPFCKQFIAVLADTMEVDDHNGQHLIQAVNKLASLNTSDVRELFDDISPPRAKKILYCARQASRARPDYRAPD